MSSKKLPFSFWFLIGLAIVTALVLIVGILAEHINFKEISLFFSKKSHLSSKHSQTPPSIRQCKLLKSGVFRVPSNHVWLPEIIGWNYQDEDPSFWIYNKNGWFLETKIHFKDDWTPYLSLKSEQSIFCKKNQMKNCIPKQEEHLQDLQIKSSSISHFDGFAGIWKSGATHNNSFAAIYVQPNDHFLIKNFLGVCSKNYPSLNATSLYFRKRPFLVVFSNQPSILGIYDILRLGLVNPKEVSKDPHYLFQFSNGQWMHTNCRSLNNLNDTLDVMGQQSWLLTKLTNSFSSKLFLHQWTGKNLKIIWTKDNFKGVIKSLSFPHPRYFGVTSGKWMSSQNVFQIFKIQKNRLPQDIYQKEISGPTSLFISRKDYLQKDPSQFLVKENEGQLFKTAKFFLLQNDQNFLLTSFPDLDFKENSSLIWERLPSLRHLLIGKNKKEEISFSLIDCGK